METHDSFEKTLAREITRYMQSLEARAKARGKIGTYDHVVLTVHGDGTGVVSFGTKRIGKFSGPVDFEAAEAWLEKDEVAECNLSIGLTADGRLRV